MYNTVAVGQGGGQEIAGGIVLGRWRFELPLELLGFVDNRAQGSTTFSSGIWNWKIRNDQTWCESGAPFLTPPECPLS